MFYLWDVVALFVICGTAVEAYKVWAKHKESRHCEAILKIVPIMAEVFSDHDLRVRKPKAWAKAEPILYRYGFAEKPTEKTCT